MENGHLAGDSDFKFTDDEVEGRSIILISAK